MAPRGGHVRIAQHPRNLFGPLFALHHFDVARGNAAFFALRDTEMLIGVDGDLRQVRNDERLAALTRHIQQRLPNAAADLTTDALIHFIEDERRNDSVGREDDLERQHEA